MIHDIELHAGLLKDAEGKWRAFSEAAKAAHIPIPTDSGFVQSALCVFAFSDFVAGNLLRSPQVLDDLIRSGDLFVPSRKDDYFPVIQNRLRSVLDETQIGEVLCLIRKREMIRIAWRDLAGWADLDATMADLSAFADACLEAALAFLYRRQCETYGLPVDSQRSRQQLVVIGMGKLGARELNFSSDIDLIFAYPESGQTEGGPKSIGNEEFFVRLCRKYVNLLGTVTTEGPLFRVDIRLRPFGDNGPLVMSFDNMEDYYQRQGRDWERYALIKARVVAGDREAGERLLARLKPFVYRRYLDYGAFESIRDMKQKISIEVTRKGMKDNIKLGSGGIREIEFFGQTFQMLRGGVMPSLQCPSILETLSVLSGKNYITEDSRMMLLGAYRFLRNAEHRLQEYADQQTHQIPEIEPERVRLSLAMGFPTFEKFQQALDRHREVVHAHFQKVLEPEKEEQDADILSISTAINSQLAALWLSLKEDSGDIDILLQIGFPDPKAVVRLLDALQNDPGTRALSATGRKRLDTVVPLLLARAGRARQPMVALARLLDLVKTIQRRIVYLALLQEHPEAITRLVEFADASPWLVSYLMHHPVLLDELLDPRTLFAPPQRLVLENEIAHRMEMIGPIDLEYQMEALRIFKQVNTLRVAAADITGALPLMKVSDHLSDIAEVSVEKVVSLTWRHLTERHGVPTCLSDGKPLEHGFAVIAYGKLGGYELGYDSDLDLVFLHAGTDAQTVGGERVIDTPQFFARLGQRVLHFLTAHTGAGILYETDTRLRPSGTGGLLVSHIDGWVTYQLEKAWTWEHQALVRARGIFGEPALLARFEAVRQKVLSRRREKAVLQKEVREMRERMRQAHGEVKKDEFHLKQGRGGMVDIEFIVQYIILLAAHRYPQILKWTDNVRQIQALAEAKIISDDMAHRLRTAYLTYRAIGHRLSLQEKPPVVSDERLKDYRRTIIRFWHRVMG